MVIFFPPQVEFSKFLELVPVTFLIAFGGPIHHQDTIVDIGVKILVNSSKPNLI